ncbi:hypothetical protein ONZ45_g13585 [Pleurotus djamor]|nr:hypothetical protein ONZ45_g13585 [Pleurotus djamor]
MAGKPGKIDYSAHNYILISSLVLLADRTAFPRRDKEPYGDHLDPKEMGSYVQRPAPKHLEKGMRRVSR